MWEAIACSYTMTPGGNERKTELIVNNKEVYKKMKNIADNEGMKKFSYYKIAKESIGF